MVLGDRTVSAEKTLDTGELFTFEAGQIRREHTGIHARVSIRQGPHTLSWDNFNVEREAGRVHLANSAHARMSPGLKEVYPQSYIRYDLDDFCSAIWQTWMERYAPELLGGGTDLEMKPQGFTLKFFLLTTVADNNEAGVGNFFG